MAQEIKTEWLSVLLAHVYVKYSGDVIGDIIRNYDGLIEGQVVSHVRDNIYLAEHFPTHEARFAFVASYIAEDGINRGFLPVGIKDKIRKLFFPGKGFTMQSGALNPAALSETQLDEVLCMVLSYRENIKK